MIYYYAGPEYYYKYDAESMWFYRMLPENGGKWQKWGKANPHIILNCVKQQGWIVCHPDDIASRTNRTVALDLEMSEDLI